MKSTYINKAAHAYSIRTDDGLKMGVYMVKVDTFVAHSKIHDTATHIELAKELYRLAVKHENIVTCDDDYEWD